ncbi:ElyC/SanA/YdcF family protein [Actinoplanes sp. NPDC048796]|uniref:ElyC/SanA/YdcF family protein n=1 Tax=unclassified Actinoplanes TaxID=2626549 RepID=UPI0033E1BB96
MRWADDINTLVRFCARRDVPELTPGTADVAILFGGSIVAGAEVFAEAMRAGAADHYMIVGGEGHTTAALREALGVDGGTEAALFDGYLRERHGLAADFLEEESTNCGNNVTFALRLLRATGVRHASLILIQDATMQQRMDAGFRRHAPAIRLVNYAAHRTLVEEADGRLSYVDPPAGMWSMEHYVTLLMGEIPRMTDYGPSGRDFIAHVDVPDEVTRAFERLRADFPVRQAIRE